MWLSRPAYSASHHARAERRVLPKGPAQGSDLSLRAANEPKGHTWASMRPHAVRPVCCGRQSIQAAAAPALYPFSPSLAPPLPLTR